MAAIFKKRKKTTKQSNSLQPDLQNTVRGRAMATVTVNDAKETSASDVESPILSAPVDMTNLYVPFFGNDKPNVKAINQAIARYKALDIVNNGDADSIDAAQAELTKIDDLFSGLSEDRKTANKDFLTNIQFEQKRVNILRKKMIMREYPVTQPKIGFRFDSRPIELALTNGYVALDPQNAAITQNGENQSMVGASNNFVGSLNYRGYAINNAHHLTKSKWKKDKGKTFYWTTTVVREGGMTYEWLLRKITNATDKQRARQLILNRVEGTSEDDRELNNLFRKYGASNNIGTTEIVTESIPPEDILGYWDLFEPDNRKQGKTYRFFSRIGDDEKIDENDNSDAPEGFALRLTINDDDEDTFPTDQQIQDVVDSINIDSVAQTEVQRYLDFIKTEGTIKKSNII